MNILLQKFKTYKLILPLFFLLIVLSLILIFFIFRIFFVNVSLFPGIFEQKNLQHSNLTVKINHDEVKIGDKLLIEATLKDSNNQPLRERKIVFTYDMGWNYAFYTKTDSNGYAKYELPIVNEINRTGFCGNMGSQKVPSRYQTEIYFQGDNQYKGVMGSVNFKVTNINNSSNNSKTENFSSNVNHAKKPEPMIYWGWDYNNYNPNDAPEDLKCPNCNPGEQCKGGDNNYYACENDPNKITQYGPFGGIYYQTWNSINYGKIDAYLEKAKEYKVEMPDGRTITKPVMFGFYFFESSGDHSKPGLGSYTLKPTGCPELTVPKYCDKNWQDAYKKEIMDLGAKYDGKFAASLLSYGFDGEAVYVKNINGSSCNYVAEMNKVCSEYQFNNVLLQAIDWYKQAFPNTPFYIQGAPEQIQKAVDNGFGYKTNNWTGTWDNWAYSNISDAKGESAAWIKNPNLLRGFESKYDTFMTNGIRDYKFKTFSGTYWMFVNMLGNHPDFIDFHRDHWGAFLQYSWLNEFITTSLGKTPETASHIWTFMRETNMPKEGVYSCQLSGVYGDYMQFLYRRDNIPGNKTVAVKYNQLPNFDKSVFGSEMQLGKASDYTIQKQPYTLQPYTYMGNTDSQGNAADSYIARRTDQSNGNNFMSFDIDNGWSFAGLIPNNNLSYKITLIYLDKGSDMISIEYPDRNGNPKKINIQKNNSLRWIRKEDIILNDAYFNDQLDGMTDIRINCNGDGDEIIHMLDIQGYGDGIIPTPGPTPTYEPRTPSPIVSPTVTPFITPTPSPSVPPVTPDPDAQTCSKLVSGIICYSTKSICDNKCMSKIGMNCKPLTTNEVSNVCGWGQAQDNWDQIYGCCENYSPTTPSPTPVITPTPRLTPTPTPIIGACSCEESGTVYNNVLYQCSYDANYQYAEFRIMYQGLPIASMETTSSQNNWYFVPRISGANLECRVCQNINNCSGWIDTN